MQTPITDGSLSQNTSVQLSQDTVSTRSNSVKNFVAGASAAVTVLLAGCGSGPLTQTERTGVGIGTGALTCTLL